MVVLISLLGRITIELSATCNESDSSRESWLVRKTESSPSRTGESPNWNGIWIESAEMNDSTVTLTESAISLSCCRLKVVSFLTWPVAKLMMQNTISWRTAYFKLITSSFSFYNYFIMEYMDFIWSASISINIFKKI